MEEHLVYDLMKLLLLYSKPKKENAWKQNYWLSSQINAQSGIVNKC